MEQSLASDGGFDSAQAQFKMLAFRPVQLAKQVAGAASGGTSSTGACQCARRLGRYRWTVRCGPTSMIVEGERERSATPPPSVISQTFAHVAATESIDGMPIGIRVRVASRCDP